MFLNVLNFHLIFSNKLIKFPNLELHSWHHTRTIPHSFIHSHSRQPQLHVPRDKLSAHAAVIARSCTLLRLCDDQIAGELLLSLDRSLGDSRKKRIFRNFWQFSAALANNAWHVRARCKKLNWGPPRSSSSPSFACDNLVGPFWQCESDVCATSAFILSQNYDKSAANW